MAKQITKKVSCDDGSRSVYTTWKYIPRGVDISRNIKKSAIDEFLVNGRLFHICVLYGRVTCNTY